MLIGIDLDNTIVCYEEAIKALSLKIDDLPRQIEKTKNGIKTYMKNERGNDEWTRFQGELYGPGMQYANPFDGVVSVMKKLRELGNNLAIISHRTRKPYAGEAYDLHKAASLWIRQNLECEGLFENGNSKEVVYFRETKEQKIDLIGEIGCDVFIDDLYEIISSPRFPCSTKGILFSPDDSELQPKENNIVSVGSWKELFTLIESYNLYK